jgi:hypothetical protein
LWILIARALWATQPGGLGQARQVHTPGAVPQNRVEIHVAMVAVGEGERERAPDVIQDMGGIEVRNPTPAGGHADRCDRRGIAIVGAGANEPARMCWPSSRTDGEVEALTSDQMDFPWFREPSHPSDATAPLAPPQQPSFPHALDFTSVTDVTAVLITPLVGSV